MTNFPRPLLVVGTDSPPKCGSASVQVWDTRNGRGTLVFKVKVGSDELDASFVRGISSSVTANGTPILLVGVSTGEVLCYKINKKAQLEKMYTLKGLTAAAQCVSGDCTGLPVVAASDENGSIFTWMHGEEQWDCMYRFRNEDDYCSVLGLKGNILVTGHSSGRVLFHDIRQRHQLFQIFTNSKSATCLSIHPTLNVALIGGEDGRITILDFSGEGHRVVQVVLSVCQNAAVLGGTFTCSRPGKPDVMVLLWERPYLVKYEYEHDN